VAAQILREIPRSALEIPQDNLERLLLESYTIDGWVPTEMDVLGYHKPGLVGLGAVFAAVYGAFAKFDGDQSEENRKFVRDWLLGLKVDAAPTKLQFSVLPRLGKKRLLALQTLLTLRSHGPTSTLRGWYFSLHSSHPLGFGFI